MRRGEAHSREVPWRPLQAADRDERPIPVDVDDEKEDDEEEAPDMDTVGDEFDAHKFESDHCIAVRDQREDEFASGLEQKFRKLVDQLTSKRLVDCSPC